MAKITESSAAAQKRGRSEKETIAEEISRENAPDSPVVEHLQRQVANALVLYLNYKHYHWQTYGPLFRDLHPLFDEFAKAVLDSLDEFAERVRMIGQDPVASPQEMLMTASVQVAARGQTMVVAYAEDLLGAGLNVSPIVRVGDPKNVLVAEAKRLSTDCMFVGSTGFSNRLERFLLGSVSSTVANRAECSVEVVR